MKKTWKVLMAFFSWTFHITSHSLHTSNFPFESYIFSAALFRAIGNIFYASDVGWMNDAKWIETGMTEMSIESLGWCREDVLRPSHSLTHSTLNLFIIRFSVSLILKIYKRGRELLYIWHYSVCKNFLFLLIYALKIHRSFPKNVYIINYDYYQSNEYT